MVWPVNPDSSNRAAKTPGEVGSFVSSAVP